MDGLYQFFLSLPGINDDVIKIALAILLGTLTGLEREYRGRAAGVRTMMLVCLGSTIVMVGSVHISEAFSAGMGNVIRVDPARIAAGIVTGIGFLGAGAIIRYRKATIGLTTASLIWFNASLGILIGLSLYAIAIGVSVVTVVLLIGMNWWERVMNTTLYRDITVVGAYHKDLYAQAKAILENDKFTISQQRLIRDMENGVIQITFNVKAKKSKILLDTLDHLSALPGVQRIEWE